MKHATLSLDPDVVVAPVRLNPAWHAVVALPPVSWNVVRLRARG